MLNACAEAHAFAPLRFAHAVEMWYFGSLDSSSTDTTTVMYRGGYLQLSRGHFNEKLTWSPKIPHFHSTSEAKRSECVGLSAWVKPFYTLLMLLAIFKFYSCRFNWTRIYAASLRIVLSVIFAENLFCVIHHNSTKYHISTAWAKRSGANAWASAHALSMVTWYHQNVVDLLIE